MTIQEATNIILQLQQNEQDAFFACFFSKEENQFKFYRNNRLDMGDALVIIEGLCEEFHIDPRLLKLSPNSKAYDKKSAIATIEKTLKHLKEL